jgi:hypothetical protein
VTTQSRTTQSRIERGDIEAKLRELTSDVNQQADKARSKVVTGGIVVLVITVILVFLLGRRAGREGTTIVEVRRF